MLSRDKIHIRNIKRVKQRKKIKTFHLSTQFNIEYKIDYKMNN